MIAKLPSVAEPPVAPARRGSEPLCSALLLLASPMDVTLVLAISIVLQFLAGILALRLIFQARHWPTWTMTMMAAAIVLMGVRRSIVFYRVWSGDNTSPPDLTAELVALAISILMTVGIASIGPILRAARQVEEAKSFRLLIEAAPNAIVLVDAAGRIQLINRQAEQMFGYHRSELLGEPVELLIPQRLQDAHAALRESFFTAPEARDMGAGRELFGLRKDDSEFPVEVGLSPVEIGGQPMVSAMIADITARRQAEAEREQLFISSPDLMCVANLEGFFERVNPAFERNLGWTQEELLSRPFLELIHPDDVPQTLEALEDLGRQVEVINFDNRYQCKDGSYRWLTWNCPPPQPGSNKLYAVARDTTARRAAEQALKQAHDELATANEELSEYAHFVSHDLRTPLRAIRNYCDFLREDLDGTLAPDQQQYLDGLRKAVDQAHALVKDLRAITQIERQPLRLGEVDLGALLSETFERLDCGGELILCDELPTLVTDQSLLRQMFENLLANAVKFNRSPTPYVEVGADQTEDGRIIRFYVRDNGIGIDPRFHDQIFNTFERLHTAEAFDGTGIGLAIVRRVADRLGGCVAVQSELDQGSTFVVSLPRQSIRPR